MIEHNIDKWVILGTANCIHCDKVKKLMDSYRIKYEYFSLDPHSFQTQGYSGPNNFMLRQFVKAAGYETVPIVFWGGDRVGGYEETLSELVWTYGKPPID